MTSYERIRYSFVTSKYEVLKTRDNVIDEKAHSEESEAAKPRVHTDRRAAESSRQPGIVFETFQELMLRWMTKAASLVEWSGVIGVSPVDAMASTLPVGAPGCQGRQAARFVL